MEWVGLVQAILSKTYNCFPGCSTYGDPMILMCYFVRDFYILLYYIITMTAVGIQTYK